MKKNQFIILFFLVLSIGSTSAQQLTPFVVSSSGGFYNNTAGMLSFTTGEMTAVETFSSPSNILTQGFQQAFDFGTYITEHPNQHFSFGIYPNPSDGNFNLVTETEVNEHIVVKILDVLGKEILRTAFYHQNKINVQPLDLSHAAQGIYLIALTVKENNSSPAYHFIQKIHIVK